MQTCRVVQDGGIRNPEIRSQVPNLAAEKRSFPKVKSILQVTAAYANISQDQRGTTCYETYKNGRFMGDTICGQLFADRHHHRQALPSSLPPRSIRGIRVIRGPVIESNA